MQPWILGIELSPRVSSTPPKNHPYKWIKRLEHNLKKLIWNLKKSNVILHVTSYNKSSCYYYINSSKAIEGTMWISERE